MFNEELDLFIARFRQTNSVKWPYLRYAVNYMYERYYKCNRTKADAMQDVLDGEWVDIKDDDDDEIVFRANVNLEDYVLNDQLNDTMLYNPSLRQQDECQDQHETEGDTNIELNYAVNNEQAFDYDTQYSNTFYTVNDYWDYDQTDDILNDENIHRQVDDEFVDEVPRYITHIQDGYTEEQHPQETYDDTSEGFEQVRAQEVWIADFDLNMTEVQVISPVEDNEPVMISGLEPEPHTFYIHETTEPQHDPLKETIKKEIPSFTPTPWKKPQPIFKVGTPSHEPPKIQSKSMAKLTNMFAEDPPQSRYDMIDMLNQPS